MRFMRTVALFISVVVLQTVVLQAAVPPVPRHAPEFVIHFPDGSQSLLSSYHGKAVALLFVYTTCVHCQHTSQVFTKLYAEYGARGFQPLDVAFNEMANLFVKDFVKEFGITYPVGFSPRDPVMDYLGIPVIERYVVPQIVWIDRKGNIRSQTPPMGDEKLLKESYWREMIETLLKEPAESAKKPAVHHATSAKKT
jgi:peroxiredoxin